MRCRFSSRVSHIPQSSASKRVRAAMQATGRGRQTRWSERMFARQSSPIIKGTCARDRPGPAAGVIDMEGTAASRCGGVMRHSGFLQGSEPVTRNVPRFEIGGKARFAQPTHPSSIKERPHEIPAGSPDGTSDGPPVGLRSKSPCSRSRGGDRKPGGSDLNSQRSWPRTKQGRPARGWTKVKFAEPYRLPPGL